MCMAELGVSVISAAAEALLVARNTLQHVVQGVLDALGEMN